MVIEQSDMYAEIVHHIVCRNPSPWNRNRVILPNQSSRVQFFFWHEESLISITEWKYHSSQGSREPRCSTEEGQTQSSVKRFRIHYDRDVQVTSTVTLKRKASHFFFKKEKSNIQQAMFDQTHLILVLFVLHESRHHDSCAPINSPLTPIWQIRTRIS